MVAHTERVLLIIYKAATVLYAIKVDENGRRTR